MSKLRNRRDAGNGAVRLATPAAHAGRGADDQTRRRPPELMGRGDSSSGCASNRAAGGLDATVAAPVSGLHSRRPFPELTPAQRRLLRALELDVTKLSDGSWLVSGGRQPHHVTDAGCDCRDAAIAGADAYRCKHRLRLLLRDGDPATWAALRVLSRRLLVDYHLARRSRTTTP